MGAKSLFIILRSLSLHFKTVMPCSAIFFISLGVLIPLVSSENKPFKILLINLFFFREVAQEKLLSPGLLRVDVELVSCFFFWNGATFFVLTQTGFRCA